MNTKILQFIREMKELTDESFSYEIMMWEMRHLPETYIRYSIRSGMNGFLGVEKETEEELIDSFDLIRKLVGQLTEVKETNKRINTKLIENKYPIGD